MVGVTLKTTSLSATSNLPPEQNSVHLGRFLHFSQKVDAVTLKTEALAASSNLHGEQNLVHLGRFLHLAKKVVRVTLKTEAFMSNFQFTCRTEFSAFG